MTTISFGYGINFHISYDMNPRQIPAVSNRKYFIENTDDHLLHAGIELQWDDELQQVILHGVEEHQDYCNRHDLEDDTLASDLETIALTIEYLVKTAAIGKHIH